MKEKKIARDTRNREKLAGDDWVMAEFYATWCSSLPAYAAFDKRVQERDGRDSRGSTGGRRQGK